MGCPKPFPKAWFTIVLTILHIIIKKPKIVRMIADSLNNGN